MGRYTPGLKSDAERAAYFYLLSLPIYNATFTKKARINLPSSIQIYESDLTADGVSE